MLLEGPPNIWLETHSSLTVSNSIPAQQVRERREEEEKKEERRKKKIKRSKGALNPTGRASDDTRPLSLWIIHVLSQATSQKQIIPQSYTLMWSKQLHARSSLLLTFSLSCFLFTVPDNDAGCGNVSPESRKNRCGPDTALILLRVEKNTVARTVTQLETVQVWQVRSVKTDGCFSTEAFIVWPCPSTHKPSNQKK